MATNKFPIYKKTLFDLDKEGYVPIERSDASDAHLVDILLSKDMCHAKHHTQDACDNCCSRAAAAIDDYYQKRPIIFGTLLRAQEEFERSKEGRVFFVADSSISALASQTAAALFAVTGMYELSAVCFAIGMYKAYDAIRIAKRDDG